MLWSTKTVLLFIFHCYIEIQVNYYLLYFWKIMCVCRIFLEVVNSKIRKLFKKYFFFLKINNFIAYLDFLDFLLDLSLDFLDFLLDLYIGLFPSLTTFFSISIEQFSIFSIGVLHVGHILFVVYHWYIQSKWKKWPQFKFTHVSFVISVKHITH